MKSSDSFYLLGGIWSCGSCIVSATDGSILAAVGMLLLSIAYYVLYLVYR